MKTIIITSLVFLLSIPAYAQEVVPGEFVPTEICYQEGNEIIHEVFDAPVVVPDFGPVAAIDISPIDPDRQFENIPTFGLAKWHWWVFSQQLFRAQRQYADCVGQIKLLQELLGLSPLIDDPAHPLGPLVLGVREYEASFEPIQPITREYAIAHAIAAANTTNLVVASINACKQTVQIFKEIVRSKLR